MPNTSLREAAPTASLQDALRVRSVQVPNTPFPTPHSPFPTPHSEVIIHLEPLRERLRLLC
ncbi:MAG: hypothetical protein V7K24_20700 [Nostoc sp.]